LKKEEEKKVPFWRAPWDAREYDNWIKLQKKNSTEPERGCANINLLAIEKKKRRKTKKTEEEKKDGLWKKMDSRKTSIYA